MLKINFNGYDLTEYLVVNRIEGRGLVGNDLSFIDIPHKDGGYVSGVRRGMRELIISYTIKSVDAEDLRDKITMLNEILAVKEDAPIKFPDEPGITYYGIPETVDESDEFITYHKGKMSIICSDPYKYHAERVVPFNADIKLLQNEGNETAKPVFEIDVVNPATFAMITVGDNTYNMIGQPAEDGVTVVADKTLKYSLDGISGWSSAGTDIDGLNEEIQVGTMIYDGTGLTPSSYGSGAKGHGPAVIRDLGESLQDFKIDTVFEQISNTKQQNARLEMYCFDENMNMLGKIGYVDGTSKTMRIRGRARVGREVQEGSYKNYLIGRADFELLNVEHFQIATTFQRKGNVFTFQIAQLANGKLKKVVKRTFVDATGLFAGKMRYVQVYIRRYGTPAIDLARVNDLKVYELNEYLVDDTPYVVYPGDKVVFDHETKNILINGESRKDLKQFGGNYFELDKGENRITVSPENAFVTVARYKERSI